MTDKTNDPVAMWQKMMGEMEKGFNSFANQAISSPEFSQVDEPRGGVAAGAQSSSASSREKYSVSDEPAEPEQVAGLAGTAASRSKPRSARPSRMLKPEMVKKCRCSPRGRFQHPRPPRTKRPPFGGAESRHECSSRT